MIKYLIILTPLFLAACGTNQDSGQRLQGPQGTSSAVEVVDEPFDLKVKKYEDPTRQSWQDPKFVLDELGDLRGKTVADIGSGTGYFTFQLAVLADKVIAIDIEPRFLNYIEDRKVELSNSDIADKIETRLIQPNEPSLKEQEVDAVLIVNSIAYIDNRVAYLSKVLNGIQPQGRLVIVDYKLGDLPVGPEEDLKIGVDELGNELLKAGFDIASKDTSSLQYQYIITSTKK